MPRLLFCALCDLPLLLAQPAAQLLQLLTLLQQPVCLADTSGDRLTLLCLLLRLPVRFLLLRRAQRKLLHPDTLLFQLPGDLTALPRLSQKLILPAHLLFQSPASLLQITLALFIPLQQLLQKLGSARRLSLEPDLFQLFQFLCGFSVLCAHNPVHVLDNAPSQLIIRLPSRLYRVPQSVLQLLIQPGMKDLTENLAALCRSREQQLLEISLRDHRDLCKLTVVQPHQLRDCLRHLPRLRNRLPPVRIDQLRVSLLRGVASPSSLRALILRISPDAVLLPLIGENKLHIGGRVLLRIFAPEHPGLPHFPARLAVERKGDRVKQRCLSRPSVSCNQEKASVSERGKVNLRLPRVGSERA